MMIDTVPTGPELRPDLFQDLNREMDESCTSEASKPLPRNTAVTTTRLFIILRVFVKARYLREPEQARESAVQFNLKQDHFMALKSVTVIDSNAVPRKLILGCGNVLTTCLEKIHGDFAEYIFFAGLKGVRNKKPAVETTGACDQKDHMRKQVELFVPSSTGIVEITSC